MLFSQSFVSVMSNNMLSNTERLLTAASTTGSVGFRPECSFNVSETPERLVIQF